MNIFIWIACHISRGGHHWHQVNASRIWQSRQCRQYNIVMFPWECCWCHYEKWLPAGVDPNIGSYGGI